MQALVNYLEALNVFSKYFGIKGIEPPEILTKYYWHCNGTNLYYQEEKFYLKDFKDTYGYVDIETTYSTPVLGPLKEGEDYSLTYIDNQCGQQYYVILDNSKRIR